MKSISVLDSFSLEGTIDQDRNQAEDPVDLLRSAQETFSATQALEDPVTTKPLKSKSPLAEALEEKE